MLAPSSLKNSRYVWSDDTGAGRNVFALFVRRFHLNAVPSPFFISLFADSLYRLWVNGTVIGYGPARFLPAFPQYDTYELSAWLRRGENSILVEVNSRGAPSFQSVESKAGFIAWGGQEIADLSTPGQWLVQASQAWDPHAEPFSFAQGPIEILDQRELPPDYPLCLQAGVGEEWSAPTLIRDQSRWGKLEPREIALPSMQWMEPTTIVTAAAIQNGHLRHGFNARNGVERRRRAFFTHVHSPISQEVEIGMFWGPVYLNGVEVKQVPCERRGNRENARLLLEAGWNFIYGTPELLRSCWTWLMEFPSDQGLSLAALPNFSCGHTFALGPVLTAWPPPAGVPSSLAALTDFPQNWELLSAGQTTVSPARELAWDIAGPAFESGTPYREEIVLTSESGTATLVLDMGGEYLGHARVEFVTAHGAVVDVAYDERLKSDGTILFFACNPFINSADRFICGPGPQVISIFHERGGRYLQITFRQISGPVIVRRAGVIRSIGDYPVQGAFRCSDPLFNWIWQAGVATLRASMSDGWIDPWRERGMYIGDAIVQAIATRKFNRDTRLEAWAIRLWARGQFDNGQIPDVVPSAHETPLSDYSLLWILLLRNYWSATGDCELVREVWPTIGRVFESPSWKSDESGLWEAHRDCVVFVDWGRGPDERCGVNTVLNAFRLRAHQCAAEMGQALGFDAEARRHAKQAQFVLAAFRKTLWDQDSGRYSACLLNGTLSRGPALHGNAAALAFGLATAAQEKLILTYLREGLRDNVTTPEGWMNFYFMYYLFEGLYAAREAGFAEDVMRANYAIMKERGAWTLWESLERGKNDLGSLCHGWACSPLIFFAERILGVRELNPGDDTQLLIAPESDSLEWAEGRVPHRRGLVQVSWRIEGGQLKLSASAPEGVRLHIRPTGRLGKLYVADEERSLPIGRLEHSPEDVRRTL